MKLSEKWIISIVTIAGFCSVLFAASPGWSQKKAVVQPAIQPGAMPDNDGVLQKQLNLAPPLKTSGMRQLGNRQIMLSSGKKMKLKDVATLAFQNQNEFAASVGKKQLVGKAILAMPVVREEVSEFDDLYVLKQSTQVIVTNPSELKAISPQFASLMASRAGNPLNMSALDKSERESIADIIANIDQRDPNDPLRLAAAKGEQALLDAIQAGLGEITVEDTFIVPRTPIKVVDGVVQLPSLEGGTLNFKTMAPVNMALVQPVATTGTKSGKASAIAAGGKSPGNALAATSGPEHAVSKLSKETIANSATCDTVVNEQTGQHEFSLELLNGFTLGNAWMWERRWDFSVGFFRITYGAGYGIGLRIPIEVKGKLSPVEVNVCDANDSNLNVETRLEVNTLDADAEYYRRAGLSNNKVFNGHELVLEFQVGYGYKLHLFGKDVAKKSYDALKGLHFSQNTRPPFGAYCPECGVDIAIPPEITETEIDFQYLKGALVAGIHLNGKGTVSIEKTDSIGGKTSGKHTITFSNKDPLGDVMTVPKTTLRGNATHSTVWYGLKLDRFQYHIDLHMIPELKFSFTAGYKGFNRSFNSPWIRLSAFAIDLPNYTLGSHEGTVNRYVFENGRKQFTKIENTTTAKPGDRVRPIAAKRVQK